MAQAVSITSEDVVTAFGKSERYPLGSEQFEIVSPFIGQLVDVVGEDRLGEVVGFGNICEVTGRFVRSLAGNSDFQDALGELEGPMMAMLYNGLADQIEQVAANPDLVLIQMGISEADAMEMDSLGLNDEAKVLYRAGELTFARLLTVCPEVFVPVS